MKLAFVSAHPAPYRDPFLRRLAVIPDNEVKIFSLFADDRSHSFWHLKEHGYPSELIGNRDEHWTQLFFRLLRRVVFGGFDFIVWPGFHRPCVKAAIVLCALFGKRYGFCADSISQPQRGRFAMAIKRFVVRHAKMIFVPGNASKTFFMREFSYPESRICLGQYALEGKGIENNVLELRKSKKDEIRDKHGLASDEIVFLMVANMLQSRHYPITARAFVRFAEEYPNTKFVMVGKGPDLSIMEEMSSRSSNLKIIPGVSFSEMQELYSVADVYVHGGTEPASTALVIGAISHLPLISSPAVGCFADVVIDGKTGVAVNNYLSEEEWVDGFCKIMSLRDKWQTFGEEARRLSKPLDCDVTVVRFVNMASKVLQNKKGD